MRHSPSHNTHCASEWLRICVRTILQTSHATEIEHLVTGDAPVWRCFFAISDINNCNFAVVPSNIMLHGSALVSSTRQTYPALIPLWLCSNTDTLVVLLGRCVGFVEFLKKRASPLQHIQVHEPCATLRRCKCSCDAVRVPAYHAISCDACFYSLWSRS